MITCRPPVPMRQPFPPRSCSSSLPFRSRRLPNKESGGTTGRAAARPADPAAAARRRRRRLWWWLSAHRLPMAGRDAAPTSTESSRRLRRPSRGRRAGRQPAGSGGASPARAARRLTTRALTPGPNIFPLFEISQTTRGHIPPSHSTSHSPGPQTFGTHLFQIAAMQAHVTVERR